MSLPSLSSSLLPSSSSSLLPSSSSSSSASSSASMSHLIEGLNPFPVSEESDPLDSRQVSNLSPVLEILTPEEDEKKFQLEKASQEKLKSGSLVKSIEFIAENKKTLLITAVVISAIALTVFFIPVTLLPIMMGSYAGILLFVADHYAQDYISHLEKKQSMESAECLLNKAKSNPQQKECLENYLLKELSSKHFINVKKKLKESTTLSEEEIEEEAFIRLDDCVDEMMKGGSDSCPAGKIQACLLAKEKFTQFNGSDQEKRKMISKAIQSLAEAGIKNAADMGEDLMQAINYIDILEEGIFNSEMTAASTAKMFLDKIPRLGNLDKEDTNRMLKQIRQAEFQMSLIDLAMDSDNALNRVEKVIDLLQKAYDLDPQKDSIISSRAGLKKIPHSNIEKIQNVFEALRRKLESREKVDFDDEEINSVFIKANQLSKDLGLKEISSIFGRTSTIKRELSEE